MTQNANVGFERQVLGTAMWSADGFSQVIDAVQPDWFTDQTTSAVYGSLRALYERDVDEVTVSLVARELQSRGHSQAVTPAMLNEIAKDYAPLATLPHLLNDLRMSWVSRTAKAKMQASFESVNFNGGDPADLLATLGDFVRDIDLLHSEAAPQKTATLTDVLRATRNDIVTPDKSTTYPTGWRDIDDLTNGGLRPGQMVIIAARPATGKSVGALNICAHLSIDLGVPTLYFSREMLGHALGKRLMASRAKIALDVLNGRKLNQAEGERFDATISDIHEAPLYIDDSTDADISEIIATAKQAQRRYGVKVIVVDYVQLVGCKAHRNDGRQAEMAEVSKQLKRLALATGLAVVAVAQLNRGPEQRADKKPQLADLRESGQLEQDADMAILLHREDMYSPDTERAGEVDLIVAKHRDGATKTISLAFQGHFSRMVDMYHEPNQGQG